MHTLGDGRHCWYSTFVKHRTLMFPRIEQWWGVDELTYRSLEKTYFSSKKTNTESQRKLTIRSIMAVEWKYYNNNLRTQELTAAECTTFTVMPCWKKGFKEAILGWTVQVKDLCGTAGSYLARLCGFGLLFWYRLLDTCRCELDYI